MFSDQNSIIKLSNANNSKNLKSKKNPSIVQTRKPSNIQLNLEHRRSFAESKKHETDLNEKDFKTSRSNFQIRKTSNTNSKKNLSLKRSEMSKEELEQMQTLIKELEMKKLQKEREISMLENEIDNESMKWLKDREMAISHENLLLTLQEENERLEAQLQKELKSLGIHSETEIETRNKQLGEELKIWKNKNTELDDIFHMIRVEEENLLNDIQKDFGKISFSKLEELFENLSEFIEKNDTLNESIYMELKSSLEEKKQEYNVLKNELETFNSLNGFEKEMLQKELFGLNFDFSSKKEVLEKKTNSLKALIAKEEKEKNQLILELKEALGKNFLTENEIEEEITLKEKEVQALKLQIKTLQKINNEDNLQALLEKTRTDYDDAKQEYNRLKEEVKQLRESNTRMQEEARRKESEWSFTQKAIDEEIEGYNSLLLNLQKEKDEAEEELKRKEQELYAQEANKTQEQKDYEEKMEAELFVKKQQNEALKASIEEKNRELEKIQAENIKVEAELKETNELLMAYHQEIEKNMDTLNELTEKESTYLLNLTNPSPKTNPHKL